MSSRIEVVLLVEDDPDDRLSFQRSLNKSNVRCRVEFAEDGRQALDRLEGNGRYSDRNTYPFPDLVFLDLKLPYLNGIEVLQSIREHSDLKSLPVVILSGSDEARDHESTAALGISGYIVKPASPEQITQALESA